MWSRLSRQNDKTCLDNETQRFTLFEKNKLFRVCVRQRVFAQSIKTLCVERVTGDVLHKFTFARLLTLRTLPVPRVPTNAF